MVYIGLTKKEKRESNCDGCGWMLEAIGVIFPILGSSVQIATRKTW